MRIFVCRQKTFKRDSCFLFIKASRFFLCWANFPQQIGWLQVVRTNDTCKVIFCQLKVMKPNFLVEVSAMTSRTQSMQVAMELV